MELSDTCVRLQAQQTEHSPVLVSKITIARAVEVALLPEFNLCSVTEVRALKNCLPLESCAKLLFNDHREDIRVLTCSAGQNGNKILCKRFL